MMLHFRGTAFVYFLVVMVTCFRGNPEEFYGEVLLLDGRKITLMGKRGVKRSSRAAAILDQVLSQLQVEEAEFFGLKFSDDKQQTHWLDPSKTISQHRALIGPPYIFYFGVKFYVEDPSKLKNETTRSLFYLQVRQDVIRGHLPCPAHLRPRLFALMLQADGGDHEEPREAGPVDDGQEEPREAGPVDDGQEQRDKIEQIYKSLRGVSRPQAQDLVLSLCSSLQMFGVFLFAAYGENQTEYFLGPTPAGVVIYKNKVLVGKYFWQKISKLHFKEETFELRVVRKKGLETSFFFQTAERSDCKRLWKCCVDHHGFFRMSKSSPKVDKLKLSSRSPSLKRLNISVRKKNRRSFRADQSEPANHRGPAAVCMQTAPPAVHRPEPDTVKPSAPWETSGPLSGLYNPKFTKRSKEEEKKDGGRPQRRSRSLDGDQPIRTRGRSNISSGSDSDGAGLTRGHRRRGGRHGDRTSRTRARSCSPDAQTWKHIQKQLVEPAAVIDRCTEEIPYMDVRVSGEPIRRRRHSRGRRLRQWASASDTESKVEMVPPLPVSKPAASSCGLPRTP